MIEECEAATDELRHRFMDDPYTNVFALHALACSWREPAGCTIRDTRTRAQGWIFNAARTRAAITTEWFVQLSSPALLDAALDIVSARRTEGQGVYFPAVAGWDRIAGRHFHQCAPEDFYRLEPGVALTAGAAQVVRIQPDFDPARIDPEFDPYLGRPLDLPPGDGVFGLIENDRLVAICDTLTRSQGVCAIEQVYVLEAHRRQRHASKLVATVGGRLLDAACGLVARIERGNAPSVRLFSGLGFRPTGSLIHAH